MKNIILGSYFKIILSFRFYNKTIENMKEMKICPENMKEVKTMVGIVVTVLIGGSLGITTISLCSAAKWADENSPVNQTDK